MDGRMSEAIWDPSRSTDWDDATPTDLCLSRMSRDIKQVLAEETEDSLNIFISPNEQNVTKSMVLIIGPMGTPYAGGCFQFYVRAGPTFPTIPPRVRILTTGDSTVRFGPNFYQDGKVCLSILGTFQGPSWTPIMNISVVLKSIQSIFSDHALRNEPAFEKYASDDPQVVNYDRVVCHETIRVAVVDTVKKAMQPNNSWPKKFQRIILRSFTENVQMLVDTCVENRKYDGEPMKTVYGQNIRFPRFQWIGLRNSLIELEPMVYQFLEEIFPGG